MQRRTYLKASLAAVAAGPLLGAGSQKGRIQLHVDLTVDPAREDEMLRNFSQTFKPAASTQAGYLDAQMLELRSTLMGEPRGDANYRFVLTFESEELRQKWVASDVHQKVWPTIEKTLKHKNYSVLLFDFR
jgi:heme-degrading monooxygenase HmoA